MLSLKKVEVNKRSDISMEPVMKILKEFFLFLKEEKLMWLSPIVIILLLLAIFIYATEGSAVLPFIYGGF
jgi:Family of unknown function (DUF5989)